MYKICQTEQSFKRQRSLEKGLLQMMLNKSYEQISVSDFCEYMKIPRKSFYRYFTSKDGALYALIDHTLEDFFQTPVPGRKSRGNAVGDLDLFFAFWYENKAFLDALQRSSLSGVFVERATNFSVQEGLLPRQFKGLRPEIQSLAMSFAVCGLLSMVLQWHRQGFQISAAEMTHLAINMLTSPLVNRE